MSGMRLYTAGTTEYARHVIDHGFVGQKKYRTDERGQILTDPAGSLVETEEEFVEFRDMPPGGLIFSRTAEMEAAVDDDGNATATISGGPVLADDIGDFLLSIEVPEELALKNRAIEESGRILSQEEFALSLEMAADDPRQKELGREAEPVSWPFREFWLTTDEANRYRDTLKIYDSEDGEEVRPDLVGK